MYVKPAARTVEGMTLVVRDPDLKDFLPPEGRDVPETMYWQRRLIEGDVVRAEPPSEPMFIDSDGQVHPVSAIEKASVHAIETGCADA
jgi:hypothetical protein